MNTTRSTILSTREGQIARENISESTSITRRSSRTETLSPPQEQRGGNEYHTFTPDAAGRKAEAEQRARHKALREAKAAASAPKDYISQHIARNRAVLSAPQQKKTYRSFFGAKNS